MGKMKHGNQFRYGDFVELEKLRLKMVWVKKKQLHWDMGRFMNEKVPQNS